MGNEKQKQGLYAIFVHAGAGYHSRENEAKHLEACQVALKAGMNFLRNGATAVDAVEMAIMMLEDSVITNAGYGSNLNAKGVVEGDASIVDHFGRSGACGAVPSVKNPIMLARKIYDQAYKNPGLARVPPNFIAGDGAADFAWNSGVVLVPDDDLIAPGSKARYESWCKEIAEWEAENPEEAGKDPFFAWLRRPGTRMPTRPVQTETDTQARATEETPAIPGLGSGLAGLSNPTLFKNGKSLDGPRSFPKTDSASSEVSAPSKAAGTSDGQCGDTAESTHGSSGKKDTITDTVGAIAVDMFGNIAAGSSSGGIGMKHRGRVGPAALIGIGTHVIPVDPSDPEETTVAAVTSGTGEHIASTFGASTCSSRVYYSQRMGQAGCFDSVSEEEAISAMIRNEFTRHPAVVNSEFPGSIGILCVKKSVDGITFHFAHNTESFALGSMSSYDSAPSCLMSRNSRRGPIAQGGARYQPREPTDKVEEKLNDKDKKRKRK
ncbi:Threonine aspartase 1 [Penicillium rolfsii]|nr:Threonine aspartase 1 [Penicillium rolfsii]